MSRAAASAAGPAAAAVGQTLRVSVAPPAAFSPEDSRGVAFELVRKFAEFAERSCGCEATSNRAHVRRAVFFAGQGVPLDRFVTERLRHDRHILDTVARMACPVLLPNRPMVSVKVPESAPRRIIVASKTLRVFSSLPETPTCRGCDKRQRCKFFKAPLNRAEKPSLSHINRVLFGMAQYARGHLQKPQAYPFYFTPDQLTAAHALMDAVGEELAESHIPLYGNIELADEETSNRTKEIDWAKKAQFKQKEQEEHFLGLPAWMRETLRPLPGPGMTRKQRKILEEGAKAEGQDGAQPGAAARRDAEADWVEEGATPGEPAGPMVLDPAPEGPRPRSPVAQAPVIVDDPSDRVAPKRFEHLPGQRWQETVTRYNPIAGGEISSVIVRSLDGRDDCSPRVDLDSISDETVQDLLGPQGVQADPKGGYTIVDMLDGSSFEDAPQGVRQYLSFSPHAAEGVHTYRVGKPRPLNPQILEDLWRRTSEGEDELPFLTRVPFDVGPRRSGGAAPSPRLPPELRSESPERIVPPPERAPALARAEEGVVSLDGPSEPPLTEAVFAADEDLLTQVMRSEAEERVRLTTPASAPAPSARGRDAGDKEASAPNPDERDAAEDRRFAAWSSRPQPAPKRQAVGVLAHVIDVGMLSDANRLEKIGQVDADVDVPVRQAKPLPQDEGFVSAFRRPLGSPTEPGEDPLGPAAPGVDVQAIRAAAAPPPDRGVDVPGGLEQDRDYVFGGGLKFPKLPEQPASGAVAPAGRRATAVQRLPPKLGRMRQAKIEDLSDLLRPEGGGKAPRRARAAGQPERGRRRALSDEERAPEEAGSQRAQNASIVAQRVLNKQLKETVWTKFNRKK